MAGVVFRLPVSLFGLPHFKQNQLPAGHFIISPHSFSSIEGRVWPSGCGMSHFPDGNQVASTAHSGRLVLPALFNDFCSFVPSV